MKCAPRTTQVRTSRLDVGWRQHREARMAADIPCCGVREGQLFSSLKTLFTNQTPHIQAALLV